MAFHNCAVRVGKIEKHRALKRQAEQRKKRELKEQRERTAGTSRQHGSTAAREV